MNNQKNPIMFNHKIQFQKTFLQFFKTAPAKSREQARTFTQDELEAFTYQYFEDMMGREHFRDLRVIRILWFAAGFIGAIILVLYVVNSNTN